MTSANITDTGIRGYLKWLQHDQPGLYKRVAPHIAQLVPQAFSDHEQSLALGALSDDAATGVTTTFDTFDAFSGASAGTDVANAANTGAASPDIASAITNIVTAGLQAYTTQQTTQAQIDAYKQINQAQLQRAISGGTPLAVSSSSLGIPIVTGGTAAAGIGAAGVGIAVLVGLYLLGRKGRA
jgi:hypothetical protein